MSLPEIRPATPSPSDAKAFADLVAIAAADAFPQLFGAKGKQVLQTVFPLPEHNYSYDKTYFVLVDEQIAGMISGLTWPQYKQEADRTHKLIIQHMGWRALRYFWGMLQLWLVGLRLGECHKGEYYVQFVAVYPQFRGQKLGYRLMEQADAVGAAANCHQLALDVDALNSPAISLYQKSGYDVVSVSPPKPRPEIGQVFRMVKKR